MLAIAKIRENRCVVGVELDLYLLEGFLGEHANNWVDGGVR